MDRRGYLRLFGAAGTAVVAGCSALDDASSDAEFTPNASDHLAVAVGKVNTAALAVDRFQARDNPRAEGFDAEEPRERLVAAADALDRAADRAEGDRTADIDAVRTYATVVEEAVDAVVALLAASDHLEAAREAFADTATELAPVRASVSQAGAASADAMAARDSAVAASETADAERLAALDAELAAIREDLAVLSRYVTAVDGLSGGYDVYLDGVEQLQNGDARVSEEAFVEAKAAFESAVDAFESADARFTDTLPESPADVAPELRTGQRRSRSLSSLSAGNVHLVEGRLAAETARDELGNGAFEAARDALETSSERAQSASLAFDAGRGLDTGEFEAEFQRATVRAAALDSLSSGYLHLVDALALIEDGESALLGREFDAATRAFENAAARSSTATEAFESGRPDDGAFGTAFDRALGNAEATGALSTGYTDMTAGLEALDRGRERFDDGDYGAAEEAFRGGRDSFGAATGEFQSGQATAGEALDRAFDRALCQAGHLDAAGAHFVNAAEAADRGDIQQAMAEREHGENDLDRAEDC